MVMDDIINGFQEVFSEVFGIDGTTINRETSAKDVEGWDSVAHVLLIVALEKKFLIRFKSREITGFNSVGDMLDVAERKIDEKK